MQKLIVASHGKLAEGIKNTLSMLVRDVSDLVVLSQQEQGQEKFEEEFKDAVCDGQGYLVFTDIEGGSPASTALNLKYSQGFDIEIICGFNLPMILEAYLLRDSMSIEELATKVLDTGRNNIKKLELNIEINEEDE